MDVKSAFNNVSKALLGKRMEALELEPDLIRWAKDSVITEKFRGKDGEDVDRFLRVVQRLMDRNLEIGK